MVRPFGARIPPDAGGALSPIPGLSLRQLLAADFLEWRSPRSIRLTVARLTPLASAICCRVAFGFSRRTSTTAALRSSESRQ